MHMFDVNKGDERLYICVQLRHLKWSGMINWTSASDQWFQPGSPHTFSTRNLRSSMWQKEKAQKIYGVYIRGHQPIPYLKNWDALPSKRWPKSDEDTGGWFEKRHSNEDGPRELLCHGATTSWLHQFDTAESSRAPLSPSLELIEIKKLVSLTFDLPIDVSRWEPTCSMPGSLQSVMFKGLCSLKRMPDFNSCTSLQMFVSKRCIHLTGPSSIKQCSELKSLKLLDRHPCQERLFNLRTLSSLWNVLIANLHCGKPRRRYFESRGPRLLHSTTKPYIRKSPCEEPSRTCKAYKSPSPPFGRLFPPWRDSRVESTGWVCNIMGHWKEAEYLK